MLSNFVQRILPSPAIDELEKKAITRTLQTIVIVSMFGGVMSFLAAFSAGIEARVILIGLFLLLALSFYFLRRGILWPAQFLTPIAL